MNRTLLVIGALAAAVVAFVAINILCSAEIRGARLDLTQGHLFTLSSGSRNIIAKVDEPIMLTLYYSEKQSVDQPGYKTYSTRVIDVLREMERTSKGKVHVKVVDPEAFSDEEQEAQAAGLAALPTGRNTEPFYFGLVGEGSTDKKETVPLFDPNKEEFLEYDLTRIIYLLSNPQKKTVGLMAQLPVEGIKGYPLAHGQDVPAWKFVDALKDYFDVKTIAPDKPEIPPDLKVLLLIHPKTLSDAAQYAVDQFVLRGGHLMVFVDPFCQMDIPPGISEMQAMQLPRNSHLEKLFDAWGIEMVPDKFAADKTKSLEVNVGSQSMPEVVPYVAFLGLDKDNMSSTDTATEGIEHMNFAMPGVLRKKNGSTISFTPLIQTTTDSAMMNVADVKFPGDPKKLLTQFNAGGERLTIAARLSGKVNTAFPSGDPAKPEPPKDGSPPPPAKEHLSQSASDISVIVVADCDMLADRLWVQEQQFQGIRLPAVKFADNGDFVVSAVDNLCGSNDLIGLRARGKAARPFDRIEQIRKDADKATLTRFQEIQAKQQEAMTKLTELARKAPPGATKILLTPEDQAEREKLRKEQVDLSKQMRDIQLQRNRDVSRIGALVKFVNIGLMPLLVGVAAVGLGAYRANRRRAWSRSVGSRG